MVYATQGFDSYTFYVDPYDLARVRALGGVVGDLPDRVTVAVDMKKLFVEAFEPIQRHVLALLTGADPVRLQSAGGVELRDYDSQRPLWSLR